MMCICMKYFQRDVQIVVLSLNILQRQTLAKQNKIEKAANVPFNRHLQLSYRKQAFSPYFSQT